MGGSESLVVIGQNQWDFLPPDVPLIDFPQISSIPMFIFSLWVVWTIFWLAGIILFLVRLYQGDGNIKMRSPTLIILSAIGAEMAFSCTAWDVALTRARYPCFLDFYYIIAFLPLYFLPFVLRFLRYLIVMRRSTQWEKQKAPNTAEFWTRESTYVSILGLIMTLILATGVSIQFTHLGTWVNAYGCELKAVTSIFLIAFLAICFVFVLGGWFLIDRFSDIFPDRYHLKTEMVSCFTVWLVALLPYIIIYRVYPPASDYLGLLMFLFIATGYFSSVAWPIMISFKALPASVTGSAILQTIDELLRDDEAVLLVEKVAQLHQGQEMCEFAKAILEYRKIQQDDQMKARANEIFDTYCRSGAPRQCNLPGGMVQQISDNIGNATSDLFQRAYQEMCKLLQQNFLREVKLMPEYAALLESREKAQERAQGGQRALEA
jgi:hypothetical protein